MHRVVGISPVIALLPQPASHLLLTQQTPITPLPAPILCYLSHRFALRCQSKQTHINTWSQYHETQVSMNSIAWNRDYNGFRSQAKNPRNKTMMKT